MNSPVPIGRIQYTIITSMKKSQSLVVRPKVPANPRPKPRVLNPAKIQRAFIALPAKNQQPRQAPAPRQVAAPSAVATQQRGQAPMIQASRDRSRIVHREFLANVSGTSAYTVAQSIALNPGLAASFPWLSTQAQGWETYRFNKLRFCYYTRTGTSTVGSVLLFPDYDAADAAPATEQVASTYEDIAEDAPWKDICCEFRRSALDALGPKRFIRSGALPANQDIKTYDVGNLFVATVDGSAVSWGKLWVEYDVELMTPQLPPSGANSASATLIAGGGSVASATPFGAAPVAVNSNLVLSGSAASNVVSISGMTIGAEYCLSAGSNGTTISTYNLANPVGMTTKTLPVGGSNAINAAQTGATSVATFTATATSGSIQVTSTSATLTSTQFVMALVPTSSF